MAKTLIEFKMDKRKLNPIIKYVQRLKNERPTKKHMQFFELLIGENVADCLILK